MIRDPLGELRDRLAYLKAQRDGVLGVELTIADPTGWIPAPELARDPEGRLLALIDGTAERWGAPRHVGGALLWKTYGYWHTLPMALGWALNRRVPIMPFERTFCRESDAGVTVAATSLVTAVLPDDPCAGEPGTVVVPDLGAAVRDALLAGQGPLLAAIAGLTRVGERTLWGSTAEALVHPLPDPAEAAGLLAAVGPPVDGLITFTPEGFLRRTCCLWVTLPAADPCATCCVQPRRTATATG